MNLSLPEPAWSLANQVAAWYSALPQVEAVVLAGSQTTLVAEPGSDIDLYVYRHGEIPLDVRKAIAEASATRVEVDNQFWEPGDEWLDAPTGIHVDVMFRYTHWIEEQLERVLELHEASVGYSTCFWHNVMTSKPLFDRNGWFATLQTMAKRPYPEELRQRIIAKNHPILRDNLSSYLYQLKSALRRNDKVSLNHRITALLASYFDILFAVNRLPHPGEKRLVQIAETHCEALPEAMGKRVNDLLTTTFGKGDLVEKAERLIDGLDALLRKQGLLETKNK